MKHAILLVVFALVAGCAAVPDAARTKSADTTNALADAPLGSRIRKKSGTQPVEEARRVDVEAQQVSQSAQFSAAYNNK